MAEPRMTGRKTWAAVIGSWLAGALPIIGAIGTGDPEQIMGGVQQGLPYILAGFGFWGVGHKVEKAARTIKENGASVAGGPKPGGLGPGARKQT